jgi:penicillin-binding protein 2
MAPEGDPSTRRPPPPSLQAGGEVADWAPRLATIHRTIPALLVVLVACLGYWQLTRSAEFTARERRQSHRRVMIPATRGVIYDREHRVLAGNRTRVSVVLNLGQLRAEFIKEQRAILGSENKTNAAARGRLAVVQRHLDRVNEITGRHAQLDGPRLERAFARERITPFVLLDDLTPDESTKLAARLNAPDPLELKSSSQRWYPYGNTASHVLGRVRHETMRPAAGKDFATLNFVGTIGDSGIEKQYEAQLRGSPGDAVIQIDAWGFPVDPPQEKHDPSAGENLVLSLDVDLQLAAEHAMAAIPGAPRGAAVAISVTTGEVLVLASKPDYDLNAVFPHLTPETKRRIDAEGGWLNRATQGLYPPGSTFKIFTAMAGLRGGTLHPADVVHCNGFLDVEGHLFPCHNATGHGDLSLREALAHSCNVFAYQAGLAAGADALAAEARRFHFDRPTGIDLPFETTQMLVPDSKWKQSENQKSWTAIDTANLAIGQGFLRYSPLQAACAVASFARRETLTVPTLLHQPGRHPTGDRPAEPLNLAEGDYAALVEGMKAVIRTGMGQDAQVPGVVMAGKSGTAQVPRKEGMMNVAWFVAFAPVEHPEIAIAVAMEGERPDIEFAGAEHAAPIVREIAGAYFDKRARP